MHAEVGLAHGRIGGKVAGFAVADDAAGLDQIAAVGDGEALAGILLDEQHADAGLAHLGERLEKFVGEHRRQAERRLVEEQDLGRRHHRPADRHHLLLAAAHRPRLLAEALLESREKVNDEFEVSLLGVAGAAGVGAEHEVLAHGQLAEDAAALGHQRDAGLDDLMRRQRRQFAAAEGDRPAGKVRHQAGDRLEERALAGAVGAEDHHHLAAADVEVDVDEREVFAVGGGDAGEPKHRRWPRDRR